MADGQLKKMLRKHLDIFIKSTFILALFLAQTAKIECGVYAAARSTKEAVANGKDPSQKANVDSKVAPLPAESAPAEVPGEEEVNYFGLSSLSATVTRDTEEQRIQQWCKAYMHSYAKAAAKFVECAIKHARPLTFCEDCVSYYEVIVNLIKEIEKQDRNRPKDPDNLPTGSCMNTLLSSDMISVVGATDSFLKKLWTDSQCDACFDHYWLINGTVQFDFANTTLEFERKLAKTSKCMEQFIQIPVTGTRQEYNQSACEACWDLYGDLNDYYIEIDHHGAVCMDIVDAMNYTRNLWSQRFKCTLQQKDLAAVLTVTGVFCLLPIVFYSAAKLHSAQQHMKIIKQRRMSTVPNNLQGLDSSSNAASTSGAPVAPPLTDDVQTDDEVRRRTPKGKPDDDPEKEANNEMSSPAADTKPKVVFEI